MNDKTFKDPMAEIQNSVLDRIRQLYFPPEFRIAAPERGLDMLKICEAEPQIEPQVHATPTDATTCEPVVSHKLVAELATCLWYLKTKHFKLDWDDIETSDDDPRVRRTLSRLSKSIETLAENGIELQDPTNKRYPAGGEGMMRPIQFFPTAGITFEVVTETVAPIIYRDDRLIQRGEVFVAVPKDEPTKAVAPDDTVSAANPDSPVSETPILAETPAEAAPTESSNATKAKPVEATADATQSDIDAHGQMSDSVGDEAAGRSNAPAGDTHTKLGNDVPSVSMSAAEDSEPSEQTKKEDGSKRETTTN